MIKKYFLTIFVAFFLSHFAANAQVGEVRSASEYDEVSQHPDVPFGVWNSVYYQNNPEVLIKIDFSIARCRKLAGDNTHFSTHVRSYFQIWNVYAMDNVVHFKFDYRDCDGQVQTKSVSFSMKEAGTFGKWFEYFYATEIVRLPYEISFNDPDKLNPQTSIDKALETSKKRTDALINDPAKQPKTNIKARTATMGGERADNTPVTKPETVAATASNANNQLTQAYINQAKDPNNDGITSELRLAQATSNAMKQGGATEAQKQEMQKIHEQNVKASDEAIVSSVSNLLGILSDNSERKRKYAEMKKKEHEEYEKYLADRRKKELEAEQEKLQREAEIAAGEKAKSDSIAIESDLKQAHSYYHDHKYSLAIPYFENASKMGSDEGINGLACCYVSKGDTLKAIGYFEILEKKEDRHAIYELANIYWNGGKNSLKNLTKAIELYNKLITSGPYSRGALYILGDIYLKGGDNISKDYTKSLELFQKASEKGDPPDNLPNASAMEAIGIMYEMGTGVTKSNITALNWYKASLTEVQRQMHWMNWTDLNGGEHQTQTTYPGLLERLTEKIKQLEKIKPNNTIAKNHSDSVEFNLNTTKNNNNKSKASVTKVANNNREAITKKQNVSNGQKNTLPLSDTILNNSSIANVKKPVGNSINKDSLTAKPEVTTVKNSSKPTANAKSKTKTSAVTYKSDKEKTLSTYNASFTEGVKLYNAKNWDAALQNFSKAVEASDIIYKNNWNTNAGTFDTTAIVYAGNTAQYAKKPNVAISYYKRLADASVIAYNNTSLVDDYKFMLSNYIDAKDSGNFYHYYTVCQTLYPTTQWDSYEFNFIKKKYTLDETVSIYHQLKSDNKISDNNYQNFADYFANPRKEDVLNNDKTKLKALKYTAIDAYKNVGSKSDTNYVVAFNIGSIYSDIIEYENDNAKEKSNAIDSSISWLEKSFEFLKHKYGIEESGDKSIFSVSTGFIKNITKKKVKITFSTNDKTVFNKAREELINAYKIKRDSYSGKDAKSYKLYDKKLKETEKVMISE